MGWAMRRLFECQEPAPVDGCQTHGGKCALLCPSLVHLSPRICPQHAHALCLLGGVSCLEQNAENNRIQWFVGGLCYFIISNLQPANRWRPNFSNRNPSTYRETSSKPSTRPRSDAFDQGWWHPSLPCCCPCWSERARLEVQAEPRTPRDGGGEPEGSRHGCR